jgi:hypothetical protein
LISITLGIACVVLGTVPAEAQKGAQPIEIFSARVIAQGQLGASGTAQVQISITRWTTDEERERVLASMLENDDRSVSNTLASMEPVGTFREVSKLAYDLRYARKTTNGGKTVIILGTNRPIAMFEAVNQTRSFKHNVSVIELVVDAEGKGEGTLAAGVRIRFDEKKNQIVFEDFTFAPLRMTGVNRMKVKN